MQRLLPAALLLAALLPAAGPLWGEDEPPPRTAPLELPGEPGLREVDDAEAAPLVAALAAAAKKKEPGALEAALDAIADKRHPSFVKPLLKLLGHENSRVAVRAGEFLERRVGRDELKSFWKAARQGKENRRRQAVRAKAVRAMARWGEKLDKKQLAEVRDDWDSTMMEPLPVHGPALADLCWSFGVLDETRMVVAMAKELEAPESARGDLPDMPPDWWAKRHEQWKAMQPAAVEALRAILGRTFEKTADVRAFLEGEAAGLGIAWE